MTQSKDNTIQTEDLRKHNEALSTQVYPQEQFLSSIFENERQSQNQEEVPLVKEKLGCERIQQISIFEYESQSQNQEEVPLNFNLNQEDETINQLPDPNDEISEHDQFYRWMEREQSNKEILEYQIPQIVLDANVLTSFNPKKQLVKNVNMPKFICKEFMKEAKNHKQQYEKEGQLEAYETMKQKCQGLLQWAGESKNNYLGLDHLKSFFGQGENLLPGMNSRINRKVAHKILRRNLQKLVLENSQIKHKRSYLNAVKVYVLRLSNSILSGRVKSR